MDDGVEIKTRNAVCHIVAEYIAAEIGVAANVVEKVLAGKLGCCVVTYITFKVGLILTGFSVEFRTYASVGAIAIGVVDTLPNIFIKVFCTCNLTVGICAGSIQTPSCLEVDLGFSGLSALGGDEDDTVSTAGTVDCGRCSILEDCYGSDVFLIELRKRIVVLSRNTIDNDESI